MMRIRIPSGLVLPYQLERVAELSQKFGNGTVHVTTRQDLQIHELNIGDTPDIFDKLLEVELSPRGGGGNTVRNVTACPRSGICPDEAFDVSDYSLALSDYLLRDSSSFNLPRKFKVAFSGCSDDCAFASVADLGFFAHISDGQHGFTVYAGGGLGANPRTGIKIEEFIPAKNIFHVSEALKRLFDKYGDRNNKHKARLRYVLDKTGEKEFIRLYKLELQKIMNQGLPYSPSEITDLETRLGINYLTDSTSSSPIPGDFAVMEEKTPGFYTLKLRLRFGDIPAGDLFKIAQLARNFSVGPVRTTQTQDLLLCSISQKEIEIVISELKNLSVDVIGDYGPKIVACTGAATCKLGLCLSRGLAAAISDKIEEKAFSQDLNDVTIRISGCPNSCGHHYIADLGLQGKARRVGGKLMPYYDVLSGANMQEGNASLAKKIGSLPAKSVPSLVSEILKTGPSITRGQVENLISRQNDVFPESPPEEYYYDFGADEPFTLAGRGPGECGAGVMDVIRLDIDEAKEAINTVSKRKSAGGVSNELYRALICAARALLITSGIEPRKDREIFSGFTKHIVEPGWVKPESQELIDLSIDWRLGERKTIEDLSARIEELVSRIENLYQSLDAGLHFRLEPYKKIGVLSGPDSKVISIDLRGVICPMNFVKAKLELEKIKPGDTLEILLDDEESVRNVPESFQEQGQEVQEIRNCGDYFCVKVLRKK
jgi:sulfite reductase (ferredoxin)